MAAASHANTRRLVEKLSALPGVAPVFNRPIFHEAVLRIDAPLPAVLDELAAHGIVGGYGLRDDYPELGEALLVCATETKTDADLDEYAARLGAILRKG